MTNIIYPNFGRQKKKEDGNSRKFSRNVYEIIERAINPKPEDNQERLRLVMHDIYVDLGDTDPEIRAYFADKKDKGQISSDEELILVDIFLVAKSTKQRTLTAIRNSIVASHNLHDAVNKLPKNDTIAKYIFDIFKRIADSSL